ncbi:MAG: cell division control protein Cdc6 [Candidatus Aenigmarchaeota archaeon ex4484_52]|nr:MAG: cell division control protein Cdc6 [Candidatus Aenigmarchaeota archaeon ex4484_52]
MSQFSLEGVFNEYLKTDPIFFNKQALTISYTPSNIPHRERQIKQLGIILATALRGERPSNSFIYGSTGTGKTLVTQHVCNALEEKSKQLNKNLKILYVNCKMKRVSDTEYRLLAYLCEINKLEVPKTGLATEQIYKYFFDSISNYDGVLIIILDEIDELVSKVGDTILYNLTRINQDFKKCKLSIIGISNNLSFSNEMDARVKSSLSEEELIFPPYNAVQLTDILKHRAEISINKGRIEDGVIEKCSALSAQEHGDARRALDLLRVAGELAERKNKNKITEEDVDVAQSKIDRDRINDAIKTQPKQSKLILYTIISYFEKDDDENQNLLTGDVYDKYISLCKKIKQKYITQRRLSDIISELDMLGIINAKIISKGRYGRTREISLAIPLSTAFRIKKSINQDLEI